MNDVVGSHRSLLSTTLINTKLGERIDLNEIIEEICNGNYSNVENLICFINPKNIPFDLEDSSFISIVKLISFIVSNHYTNNNPLKVLYLMSSCNNEDILASLMLEETRRALFIGLNNPKSMVISMITICNISLAVDDMLEEAYTWEFIVAYKSLSFIEFDKLRSGIYSFISDVITKPELPPKICQEIVNVTLNIIDNKNGDESAIIAAIHTLTNLAINKNEFEVPEEVLVQFNYFLTLDYTFGIINSLLHFIEVYRNEERMKLLIENGLFKRCYELLSSCEYESIAVLAFLKNIHYVPADDDPILTISINLLKSDNYQIKTHAVMFVASFIEEKSSDFIMSFPNLIQFQILSDLIEESNPCVSESIIKIAHECAIRYKSNGKKPSRIIGSTKLRNAIYEILGTEIDNELVSKTLDLLE